MWPMASLPTKAPTQSDSSGGKRIGKIVARLGLAGFLVFLVKGLLWLIVPALLVMMGIQC